jgi:hypothetical protein
VANPRPYFVSSTASASEVLINVAVQDWFANEELDAGFYELPRNHPENSSSFLSVSDSWDSFDFVNPIERDDDATDSDLDANSKLETADEPPRSSPESPEPTAIGSPSQLRTSEPVPLSHINKIIRLVSPSVVDVTFRNNRSESPPGGNGEDNDDGEETVIIPVTPFPHPHRLSPITEEIEPIETEEDSPSPETGDEDQDDMSDTETIRPSNSSLLAGECRPHVQTDRRMSI